MEIFSPEIKDSASRDRATVANNILDFEAAIERLGSQRAAAESLNIPRSTWRHWRDRKMSMDLPAKTVSFFESPELIATIAFFWETIKTIVADMKLPKELVLRQLSFCA